MAMLSQTAANTVLIADDEPSVGYVVGLQLHEEGLGTAIFSTPEEAIDYAARNIPQLMILDYHMPRRSGIDVAAEIQRVTGGSIPVILLTGRLHQLSQTELDQAGISSVITKPFSPKQLAATVRRLLHGSPEFEAKEAV